MSEWTVRRAVAEDGTAARELFAAFPYKVAQRLAQRLDAQRLIEFYAAGLTRALDGGGAPGSAAPNSTAHWVAERDGRLLALAGLSADPWHASVYGLQMAKIAPWLNAGGGAGEPDPLPPGERAALGAALIAAVEGHAATQGAEHLSVRLDGEDFLNLHLFEAAGWRLVDVSLKLTKPLPVATRAFTRPPAAADWSVALADAADREWVTRLGSTTHGGTHFLNDPALPREKTRELFAQWLERCFDRLAYHIYTLKDAAGAGRGFVTYLRAPGFAKAIGRAPLILDFVLLDPAVRGGGLAPWFLEETLERERDGGFDYCELRTSAHNLPAVLMYEKLGFRCCATDFVLHKRLFHA